MQTSFPGRADWPTAYCGVWVRLGSSTRRVCEPQWSGSSAGSVGYFPCSSACSRVRQRGEAQRFRRVRPPLAIPFPSPFGDLLASPRVAQPAGEALYRHCRLRTRRLRLVRVSRRVRLADGASPETGDGARMIASGPPPPPAARREIAAAAPPLAPPETAAAATPPAAPLRIAAPAPGEREGAAPPVPLRRSPAPRSGTLPLLDRSDDRGLPAVPAHRRA